MGYVTDVVVREPAAVSKGYSKGKDGGKATAVKATAVKAAGKGDGKGEGKNNDALRDTIAHAVGVFNRSMELNQTIIFDAVVGPLVSCGEAGAQAILHEFDNVKANVRDPTAWLKSAAYNRSNGKGK